MQDPSSATADPATEAFLSRVVEATIRVGLLLALLAWCFDILRPFIVPIAWAVIIAVAVHPAYARLRSLMGGRARSAAALLTSVGLLLLVVPTAMLGGSLVEGGQTLAEALRGGGIAVPPPPEAVREWPVVGEQLYGYWTTASENLADALETVRPQLVAFGTWLLSTAAGAGFAFLQSLLSIAIAGVLLAHDTGGELAARSVARRLAGERGEDWANLARSTVRSVAQGILGVALIQAFLAGLGFVLVGVPGAGLWALIGLLLCVIQVGLVLVAVPIVIYVFQTSSTTVAVVFAIWMLVVSLLDNVLKPLLLGRGLEVPTVVIFLGAIGGFLSAGIIGLFVGSVVLVLGYTLFRMWLDQAAGAEASESAS
ncbi:MAG: AI-2E family transporter [Myxococcota bacterium]|nr:AI-2E family transporter [Myxococcota bacterium]